MNRALTLEQRIHNAEACQTVEEYKASIRENLKKSRQEQADDEYHSRLLDKAVENMQVVIPEGMIEDKLEEIARNYASSFGMGGMSKAQFVQAMGMTEEMFDQVTRPTAERNAKLDVLLKAVAEAEGLEPSEEEVEKLLQEIADAYQMTLEDVKAQVNMDAARDDVKFRMAADVIYSTGTDLPWSEEAQVEEILKSAANVSGEEE